MRCWLALLLAVTSAWAEPSLTGVWRCRRADGSGEVLDLMAGGRFVWRDDQGAAAAGEVVVEEATLRLRARGAERSFGYRLVDEGLEISAPAPDAAASVTGDLAQMSPRVGALPVTWRRPGWVPDPPELGVRQLSDLAGSWRIDGGPERVDRFELAPDGGFTFSGPGGLVARGRAGWQSGVLELAADGLRRRLAARLRLSNRGWSLLLRRMGDDRPDPVGDLAEMPPCLSQQAIWRRDLEPPAVAQVTGRFHHVDAAGLPYRLDLGTGGTLSLHRGTRLLGAGLWRLDGVVLVLQLTPDSGFDEVRRWSVQRLGESLVVWRARDDVGLGERAVTADLPPAEGELARWEPVPRDEEGTRP